MRLEQTWAVKHTHNRQLIRSCNVAYNLSCVSMFLKIIVSIHQSFFYFNVFMTSERFQLLSLVIFGRNIAISIRSTFFSWSSGFLCVDWLIMASHIVYLWEKNMLVKHEWARRIRSSFLWVAWRSYCRVSIVEARKNHVQIVPIISVPS